VDTLLMKNPSIKPLLLHFFKNHWSVAFVLSIYLFSQRMLPLRILNFSVYLVKKQLPSDH